MLKRQIRVAKIGRPYSSRPLQHSNSSLRFPNSAVSINNILPLSKTVGPQVTKFLPLTCKCILRVQCATSELSCPTIPSVPHTLGASACETCAPCVAALSGRRQRRSARNAAITNVGRIGYRALLVQLLLGEVAR